MSVKCFDFFLYFFLSLVFFGKGGGGGGFYFGSEPGFYSIDDFFCIT